MNKIGILTFLRSYNYGTFLQAYATQKLIQSYFSDDYVELVDFDYRNRINSKRLSVIKPSKGKYYFPKIITYFNNRLFLNNNVVRSKRFVFNNVIDSDNAIKKLNYDILISGSDEIWANKKGIIFPNSFLIPEDIPCIKFSLATSANRGDYSKLSVDELNIVFNRLNKYNYISVRDNYSYNMLKQININVNTIIADPTLAYDFPSCNISLSVKKKLSHSNKKKVLIMLSNSKIAKNVIKKYGKKYDIFSIYNFYKGSVPIIVNPLEFTHIFGEFDFVITDFFHGTVFSIKNCSNFVSIDSEKGYLNTESKIESLLKLFNISNRYIKINNFDEMKDVYSLIDFLIEENPSYEVDTTIKNIKSDYLSIFKRMKEVIYEKNVK